MCANFIVVDERRVAEHLGAFSEEFFDCVAHAFYLGSKAFLIGERGKSVAVRLAEELYLTRRVDFAQEVNDLGCMELQLFKTAT